MLRAHRVCGKTSLFLYVLRQVAGQNSARMLRSTRQGLKWPDAFFARLTVERQQQYMNRAFHFVTMLHARGESVCLKFANAVKFTPFVSMFYKVSAACKYASMLKKNVASAKRNINQAKFLQGFPGPRVFSIWLIQPRSPLEHLTMHPAFGVNSDRPLFWISCTVSCRNRCEWG